MVIIVNRHCTRGPQVLNARYRKKSFWRSAEAAAPPKILGVVLDIFPKTKT